MAALSHFLSHLYTIAMVFLTLLLLELVILVRLIASTFTNPSGRPITAARFLGLIEEKYPATRYEIGRNRVDLAECAVCLSRLEAGDEVRELNCDHTFHKVCLDTWLQQDWATCPLCRRTALPEEVVARFRQRRGEGQAVYDGSDEEFIFLLSALHGSNLHRLL